MLCLRFEDLILDRRAALDRLLDYLEQRGFRPRLARQRQIDCLGSRHRPQKIRHFPQGPARQLAGAFHPGQQSVLQRAGGRSAHPPGLRAWTAAGEVASIYTPAAPRPQSRPRGRCRCCATGASPWTACPSSSPTRSPRAARTCSPRCCRAFPAIGPAVDSGLPAVVTLHGRHRPRALDRRDPGRPAAPAPRRHRLRSPARPARRWWITCAGMGSRPTSSCAIPAMWSSRTCIT